MISLVMATYNGEKYLKEQLDSIRLQTLQPDEVLIYDDCSTDNTVLFIEEYIKKYNLKHWFIFVNDRNKGYSLNFTDAMNNAKGDLIFLADQDDVWVSDKIEKMTQIMNHNLQIGLLASNVLPYYTGEAPQKINYERFDSKKEIVKIEGYRRWIKPARPGCSMCFRKSLLMDYNLIWFHESPHDCMLWGIAVLAGKAYVYNGVTVNFRRHDTNASSRNYRSIDYRILELNREINIIYRVLGFMKERKDCSVRFLEKQLSVYRKRRKILESRSVGSALLMFMKIGYYGRIRFWFTDVYYCMKYRGRK